MSAWGDRDKTDSGIAWGDLSFDQTDFLHGRQDSGHSRGGEPHLLGQVDPAHLLARDLLEVNQNHKFVETDPVQAAIEPAAVLGQDLGESDEQFQ